MSEKLVLEVEVEELVKMEKGQGKALVKSLAIIQYLVNIKK